MFNILRDSYRCCDGLSRRSFLKVGGLSFGGLTLADMLRTQAQAEGAPRGKALSVILLWQGADPAIWICGI